MNNVSKTLIKSKQLRTKFANYLGKEKVKKFLDYPFTFQLGIFIDFFDKLNIIINVYEKHYDIFIKDISKFSFSKEKEFLFTFKEGHYYIEELKKHNQETLIKAWEFVLIDLINYVEPFTKQILDEI